MTGCSSRHSSKKRECVCEREREKETGIHIVSVRVYAVDSIKEARRVRVDCRLLISGIFSFFSPSLRSIVRETSADLILCEAYY
jgi:hypothetical protein